MFLNVCWQAQFSLLDAFTSGLEDFKMLYQLRISSKISQRRDIYGHNNTTFIVLFQRPSRMTGNTTCFFISHGLFNMTHFQIQLYHLVFYIQCKFSTALSCLDSQQSYNFITNNHCNPSHLGQLSKIIPQRGENLARK